MTEERRSSEHLFSVPLFLCVESYISLDNDSRFVIVLAELRRAAPLLFLKNTIEIAEVVESAAETDF